MPSPFPGMDPYLEGSEWTSVHTELGTEIAKQLIPQVAPKYIVRPVRRFVMDMPEKVPVLSIEIRDTAERELITTIEILSPVNKRGMGYEEYLGKRRRILHSFTHLLEIDLLRKGHRVPVREPLPHAPYFIFLSRVEKRPVMEVWPVQLNMRLPIVPVPLLAEDDDALLDVQLALNIAYETYRYDLSVDYTRPPEIPLEGETAVWAENLLVEAGLAAASKR